VRVERWLKNLNDETIWTEEIKDKNNRVAYVVLKFKLEDWLNGNLMNSFLIQQANFKKSVKSIKKFLQMLILGEFEPLLKELSYLESELQNIKSKIKKVEKNERKQLGQKIGVLERKRRKLEEIKEICESLINKSWWEMPLKEKYKFKGYSGNTVDEFIERVNKLLEEANVSMRLENIFSKLAEDTYISCKLNNESFSDFIKQIFFGSIIGTYWETWIKQTSLSDKIDWKNQSIHWHNLNDNDVDFLATLLLQFLLRKNPSPARLRRVWESLKEFFESIHRDLSSILGIPEWRKKRIVLEVKNSDLYETIKKDNWRGIRR